MNRESIIEFFQACLIILDGGNWNDYRHISKSIWLMAEKQISYMKKVEVAT